MTSFTRLALPMALAAPVLIMTSFATELTTPSVTDVCMDGHITDRFVRYGFQPE